MAKTIWNAAGLAINPVAITPNNTATNLNEHDILYVGGDGNLEITPMGAAISTKIVFTGVAKGFFPIPVLKVWATLTTATGIIGLTQA